MKKRNLHPLVPMYLCPTIDMREQEPQHTRRRGCLENCISAAESWSERETNPCLSLYKIERDGKEEISRLSCFQFCSPKKWAMTNCERKPRVPRQASVHRPDSKRSRTPDIQSALVLAVIFQRFTILCLVGQRRGNLRSRKKPDHGTTKDDRK